MAPPAHGGLLSPCAAAWPGADTHSTAHTQTQPVSSCHCPPQTLPTQAPSTNRILASPCKMPQAT